MCADCTEVQYYCLRASTRVKVIVSFVPLACSPCMLSVHSILQAMIVEQYRVPGYNAPINVIVIVRVLAELRILPPLSRTFHTIHHSSLSKGLLNSFFAKPAACSESVARSSQVLKVLTHFSQNFQIPTFRRFEKRSTGNLRDSGPHKTFRRVFNRFPKTCRGLRYRLFRSY